MKQIERIKQKESVSEYRNESRKRTFRRITQKLPKYVGSLMLVIAIYLVTTRSSLFQLEDIRIEYVGDPVIQYMNTEAISRELKQRYLSQNYFLIDPNTIRDQTDTLSPFIDQVVVTKIFPDVVELRILLHEPYLRVEHQESCYLIDDRNEVLISERSTVSEDPQVSGSTKEIDTNEVFEVDSVPGAEEQVELPFEQSRTDNTQADDPCVLMRSITDVIPVTVTDQSIQNIFNSKKFIYFDQIYVLYGILNDQGYEIRSMNVIGDGSIVELTGEVSIVIDLDDDFETQAKRLVLVLAQMDIDRPDFKQVDVRYKRPVLHK